MIPSKRFLLFGVMMFFVFLADSIMAYTAPVIMEGVLGNSTRMGFVLAMSSVVGIVADFSFAHLFHRKKTFFFQRMLFLLVFLFPLSFLISFQLLPFVSAMIWWGVSYEAMVFTTYHGIHESVNRLHHAWAWGVIAMLKDLALSIGPALASYSLGIHQLLPVFYAITLNGFAVVLFFISLSFFKKANGGLPNEETSAIKSPRRTIKETFLIWKQLDRVLWPLLFFFILFYFFDSAVNSIGPVFAEELKKQNPLGGLFISMYGIPGIFLGFFVQKLGNRFGKKKLAFYCGVLGGSSLIFFFFLQEVYLLIGCMFLASIWFSILPPAVTSVFEDLMARGENVANDIISLVALTASISYVIGPILNGFLSDQFGPRTVFGFWGMVITLFSVWLIFTFPKKIHLPQKAIAQVINENSS
jgi:Na+/melibiose symporter-like transporter